MSVEDVLEQEDAHQGVGGKEWVRPVIGRVSTQTFGPVLAPSAVFGVEIIATISVFNSINLKGRRIGKGRELKSHDGHHILKSLSTESAKNSNLLVSFVRNPSKGLFVGGFEPQPDQVKLF